MHALGPALAGALAMTASIAADANGPGSNLRTTNAGPGSNIVLVWRRFGRALGSEWSEPRPAVEPGAGLRSLGGKPSVRRLGFLWRAASADLLGLGSWECSLRLPLRRLARSDGRVG